jgi:hypothetical protein
MRGLCLLCALGCSAVVGSAGPALADSLIIQTGCDTLSHDPQRLKVHFSVANSSPWEIGVVEFAAAQPFPPPDDSCLAVACEGPAAWDCATNAGKTLWFTDRDHQIPPEETLRGFAITFEPDVCCYAVCYYPYWILEPLYCETICLTCPGAVSALTTTWGALKAHYR